MLPKKNRLKKKKEFDTVFINGFSSNDSCLEFRFKEVPEGKKIGLVAPIKIFKRATERNRIKRKMAEATKRILNYFPEGINVILIAKKPVEKKSVSELEELIKKFLNKIPKNDR